MRLTPKVVFTACVVSVSFVASAAAVEIALVPVRASGSHTLNGDEIVLNGAGQRVFLDLFISDWDPTQSGSPLLRAFQASINANGFTSGLAGALIPASQACTADVDCRVAYGGVCGFTGTACTLDSDCAFAPIEKCGGATCGFPLGIGGFCDPGFITTGRADYVFISTDDLAAVDLSAPDFRFASATQGVSVADPGTPQYCGSLVLDVPAGSLGTFQIDLIPSPASLLQDAFSNLITPLILTSARITVACAVNADCNDGDACTDDVCNPDGTCGITPNFDSATFCCNPTDRTLTPLDDGVECTVGVCDAATGSVTQGPRPIGTICGNAPTGACDAQDTCDGSGVCVDRLANAGTACGDGTVSACNNADSCDGAGVCLSNLSSAGTACGDPTNADCNGPDTCDGAGACVDNIRPTGTLCGSPSNTDCDNPDTCDGAGVCLSNLEVAGLPCGSLVGDQCDNPDTCDGAGVCEPNFVVAATPCGNPGVTECDNADTCDGSGACQANNLSDGTVCADDGNECRDDVCLGGLCSHPLTPTGVSCGNPATSECDAADSCDGNGSCASNLVVAGGACGDPTTTDCDRADTCDGSGACQTNIEVAGVVCGDPSSSDCDAPDTCDGLGMCLGNVSPAGLPCGNQVGNQCDNPDTCDGAGTCDTNFVASATPCGNPSISECDNRDTCDGQGLCDANHLVDGTVCTDDGNECRDDVCLTGVCAHPLSPFDTPCGDPTATDCDLADRCDGSGTCTPVLLLSGTLCGDPLVTGCTAADTCDGFGLCLPNDVANGTFCDDGSACTQGTSCSFGLCSGGSAVDCNDGLTCTVDSCDELTGGCSNTLIVGNCLIAGACYTDGQINPQNGCETCDTFVSDTAWTLLPVGTLCDDGDACTGTGDVGIGVDTCDAFGVCAGTVDPGCNDDCINAVEVFDGRNIGNNANRGPDDDEASCQFDSDNDVWFFYVASCPGRVMMDTIGSQFVPSNDTVLTVYDACGGAEVACDDDSGPGLLSLVEFNAVAGTTYLVRIAGFMGNAGDLVLNITTLDACVIGGICVTPGTTNPASECQSCRPALSSIDWSSKAAGSTCGDPGNNECDSPDTCDGAGVCESNNKPDGTTCIDEGNDCTNDVCNVGACTHPPTSVGTVCGDISVAQCDNPDFCNGAGACLPNFVPAGNPCGDPSTSDCDNADVCDGLGSCDPNNQVDGLICTDDGNDCSDDVCATGVCVHPPKLIGTACGDAGDTACDNPNSCDGTGVCLDNFESNGVACGDPTNTECDNPDTCNGSGSCVVNFEPVATACGDATDVDCNRADTCDGAGVCQDNFDQVGLPCGDPASTQCDNPDTCNGIGSCLSNFEPPGLTCGDPNSSQCDNADSCDGSGLCAPNHQADGLLCDDDGIECTSDACDTGQCAHPPRPLGTACGDLRNTECDDPDTCDGTGLCQDNFVSVGAVCGNPGDTDCDNPDTCDGGGACADNFEPVGFACGSVANTDCNNPDTCDGGGVCLDNFEITGFPCGDPSNTQCDSPDTCDAVGICLDNFVAAGNPCGDPSDTECDNADTCTGGGACQINNEPAGTVCSDDGNDCSDDVCALGACTHPLKAAGTACGSVSNTECDNPDDCDAFGVCQSNFEPSGLACGDFTDDQCDHPDMCDGVGLCDSNFEPDGNPCDDGDVCTGVDQCLAGTCQADAIPVAPIVGSLGPRHIRVTPQPAGAPSPVSLRVTAPAWPCLSKFVSPSGALVDVPVFQTSDTWGSINVRGQDIVPDTLYHVEASCGTFTSPVGAARTSVWGDVVGLFDNGAWTPPNGVVDVFDTVAMIEAFENQPTAPALDQTDVWPCTPDGIVDILDILQVLDAFQGMPYPCPVPCSP